MNETAIYASNLEKKLIDEFKQKFKEKLGYQPVVLTRVVLTNDFSIPLMSMDELKECFSPFTVEEYGKKIDLFSKSRKREVVELRMIFCFIARQMQYTCSSVGKYVGNRDHTTVLHNVATFKNLIETSEVFREKYTQILNHIKQKYESPIMDQFDEVQLESEPAVFP
jgi:hypothetical protein